jgi:hypothetical protein
VRDRQPDDDELYAEIERRALFDLPDDDEAEDAAATLDVVDALKGETAEPPADAPDRTLGGYHRVHGRVPAFEGSDGQPYTVDIDVEETDDPERPWVAFIVFLRWAATGAGIMDHVESGDIAAGKDADEARRNALDLSLFEVRAELDRAIERKRQETGG